MAQPKTELDELQAMESHSAKRRAERKKASASPPPAAPPAATEGATESTMKQWLEQVETIAKEMETIAKERPAVAVLVAFAAGIAVGQLISHR